MRLVVAGIALWLIAAGPWRASADIFGDTGRPLIRLAVESGQQPSIASRSQYQMVP